jgi:hypothetical protein
VSDRGQYPDMADEDVVGIFADLPKANPERYQPYAGMKTFLKYH